MCHSILKVAETKRELHKLITTEIYNLYTKQSITEFEYKVAQKRKKLNIYI